MYRTLVLVLLLGLCAHNVAATGEDEPSSTRPSISCDSMYMSTQSCQNFARLTMNEVNDQIRLELTAAYTYEAMAAYYNRDDVAYRGFAKFFGKMGTEERERAIKLQEYVVSRGGRVYYKSIPTPQTEWQTPLYGLRQALTLEKRVNDQLLDLHWLAQEKNDPHLQDYLEGNFLNEQVESVKKLAEWVTLMARVETDPVGWHIFDEELSSGVRE